MLRINTRTVCEDPVFVFLAGKQCPREAGWFKFAKISPSSGLAATLQGSALSGKNNGVTAGAALPCSETPVAPHCLRGEVQRPSLEFERRYNRAPPCLSDLIGSFDLLSPPGPAPPPLWNLQAHTCLARGPVLCGRPHLHSPLHSPQAKPPSRLSLKATSSRKPPGPSTHLGLL